MLVQTRSVGVAFYARADQKLWCRVAVSARACKERVVSPFKLVQTRSVDVAFYARADQERCVMQFRLVQARSLGSCSLGSCEQGALCLAV
ncbi:hypothetical protein TB2_037548 [Malus domestica]